MKFNPKPGDLLRRTWRKFDTAPCLCVGVELSKCGVYVIVLLPTGRLLHTRVEHFVDYFGSVVTVDE